MNNITGVINNQMIVIHPLNCEEHEMVCKSANMVRARGKGMGTALDAARETGSEKVST